MLSEQETFIILRGRNCGGRVVGKKVGEISLKKKKKHQVKG